MFMILIAGCSWGCGVWEEHEKRPFPYSASRDKLDSFSYVKEELDRGVLIHGGLAQFLNEDGYETANISILGSSNKDIIAKINCWIAHNPGIRPSKIFVFQTEYNRDYKHSTNEDFYNLDSEDELINRWLDHFYRELSRIALQIRSPVYIIGGVSDTVDPTNFKYPGVNIACQSLLQLVTTGNPNIERPLYSWYTSQIEGLIEKLKQTLPISGMEQLLKNIERGFERNDFVHASGIYFWPDGNHPNKLSHYKLYEFLKKHNYV
jgi:hypothetical protein